MYKICVAAAYIFYKKKTWINVLYSQFVNLARLNALLQVVLSQHILNYQLAIAKVSLLLKFLSNFPCAEHFYHMAFIPLSPATASLQIITTKWPSYS